MQADDAESFKREAELAIQELCPNDMIDGALRHGILEVAPTLLGQKGVPPHLVVLHLDGETVKMEVTFIESPEQWNTKAARRDCIGTLGERFARQMLKPLAVCLFTEGRATTEHAPPWLIISGVALTIDGRIAAAIAETFRDNEGRITGYGEIKSVACGSRRQNGEPAVEAWILEPFFRGYLHARFNPENAQSPVPHS